jgi:LysM repeat protein/predicted esterase
MRLVGRLLSIFALVLSTAAPAIPAQRIHTVVNGQTLGAIAHRYGISVEELREANRIPSGVRLKIGQRLLVPSPGEMARSKRSSAKTAAGDASASAADATPSGAEPTEAPAAEMAAPAEVATGKPESPATSSPSGSTEPEPPSASPPEAPAAPPGQAPSTRRSVVATERVQSGETPSTSSHKPKSIERRSHVVSDGQTLGKIAKRYHIKIESLCGANAIRRNESLKLGQEIIIPNGDEDPIIEEGPPPGSDGRDVTERRPERDSNAMKELSVPGSGPVYYYEPTGTGRMSMRPIVVYLHGRGGDAQADCRRWSKVARRFGWLLCPSGPTPHNSGRTWNNNWVAGQHAVMGSVQALRNLYGRRVQLFGNTLVGFSEGAYVAMNVGVRQPRTFNRWLILGADVSYWGGSGLEALKDAKSKVRRVVLITGGMDMVVDDTRTVAGWLDKEGVPLRIQTPGTLAHEVAIERMPSMYESALRWLDRGVEHPSSAQARISQSRP